ncbi:MAG: carbohydrate ABC transporter permease [Armatimonadota bacterium]
MDASGRSLRPAAKIAICVLLSVLGSTMVLPFLWMISTSLKEAGEVFAPQMHWIPEKVIWRNYLDAVTAIPFGRMLFNSLLVAVTVTLGQVVTSSLAAFAFARLRFPGRDALFLGYLATMMVPGVVTMIPVFAVLRILGDMVPYEFYFRQTWLGNVIGGDSYFALIAPGLFSAYGTFMLRQFFMTVPRELDEAAVIDGCSKLGVFRHVIIPLSGPALATLVIFTFMWSWRDFMWPLIINNSIEMQTLPVGLATFQSMFGINWNLLMAASVIVMLPLIIAFVFCQRFFTEGIKLAGIKG